MLSRPTWMRSARSGSSLMQKMPRLVRGDQAVVDRQLVGQVAAFGDLDRVDFADEVGDGDVRRRELLAVAAVAADPVDLERCRPPARRASRLACVIGSNGFSLISLPAMTGISSSSRFVERADHARLRLAALAEEDDVLAGEDRVLELRHDGLLVAEDAGEQRPPFADARDQVAAHLFLDRTAPCSPTASVHRVCAVSVLRHLSRSFRRMPCVPDRGEPPARCHLVSPCAACRHYSPPVPRRPARPIVVPIDRNISAQRGATRLQLSIIRPEHAGRGGAISVPGRRCAAHGQ